MLNTITSIYHPKFSLISFSQDDVVHFPFHDSCPACDAVERDRTVLRLGQPSWQKTVIISQCIDCGHVYYKNPPPPDFILRFYNTLWNKNRGEANVDAVTPKRSMKCKIASMVVDLGFNDKTLPILDVGCGHGPQLSGLWETGFKNVYGCEQSMYRAIAAGKRFPGRIFNFGYQEIPKIVDATGMPFQIIYMNHVLEHIHTPADAFKTIAGCLRDGGVIIINVPDVIGEAAINQALYLPHLHSFATASLAALGARYGFKCRFWNGGRYDELCCVFFREEAAINGADMARFRTAQTLTKNAINAVFNKIRQPWTEDSRRIVTLSWDVRKLSNGRTFIKISRLQKRLLSLLERIGDFALRSRLVTIKPIFRRTLLPLVLGKQCTHTTLSYLEYYNSPLASDDVPMIRFVDGTASFLIK
ncbi:MAG: class I SAM-dependent methyltransferase [Gammaproteobacteria bacterium]|nr:class I SAM-dependent methyltransferase [Gammaproteobacteria bacterium]